MPDRKDDKPNKEEKIVQGKDGYAGGRGRKQRG